MLSLSDIEGIDSPVVELFEAAGFTSVDVFILYRPEYLFTELAKANRMLKIVDEVPSIDALICWKESLIDPVQYRPIFYPDELSTMSEEGQRIHFATPMTEKFIESHAMDLATLPRASVVPAHEEGVDLVEIPEPTELGEESLLESGVVLPDKASTGKAIVQTIAPEKRNVDKSKLKSVESLQQQSETLPVVEPNRERDRVRMAKKETNEGVDPQSKKYIRGVLHNDGRRTYIGAYGYVLSLLLLMSSVLPIVYIVWKREDYLWGVLAPAIAFLGLCVYVFVARKSSCPVCRQRQFVPKACRKHVKAHSYPGLGNMLPTALHLISFKWFRCIFCGTAIRVKE
ncbi:hypothetical protein [Rubritalea tangerina]|uniref:Uncharacterized protein n=1 Tax=Rubritalea tangerina TaxID=430798 RepID=A0ABW4ZB00_9BACT